jgi:uncharacterized membrane protein (DUF373 family)
MRDRNDATTKKKTGVFLPMNRHQLVRHLETIQDIIVISLCIAMFAIMVLRIADLFISLVQPLRFEIVASDILFLLIMVELFRILVIYFQERQISVSVAVEASIVSVLREVILRGVLKISPQQVLVVCVFLVVLGGLLVVHPLRNSIAANRDDRYGNETAANAQIPAVFDIPTHRDRYPSQPSSGTLETEKYSAMPTTKSFPDAGK